LVAAVAAVVAQAVLAVVVVAQAAIVHLFLENQPAEEQH
jgi:hypothetical protein